MKSLAKKIIGKGIVLVAFFVVLNGAVSADPVSIDVATVRKEYEGKKDLDGKADVLVEFKKLLEQKVGLMKKDQSFKDLAEVYEELTIKSRCELLDFALVIAQDLLKDETEIRKRNLDDAYMDVMLPSLLSLVTFDDKAFKTFAGAHYGSSHLALSALCGAGVLAAGYFLWQKFFSKKKDEKNEVPEGALG